MVASHHRLDCMRASQAREALQRLRRHGVSSREPPSASPPFPHRPSLPLPLHPSPSLPPLPCLCRTSRPHAAPASRAIPALLLAIRHPVTSTELTNRFLWLLTPWVLAGPITSLPLTSHAGRASQSRIVIVQCPHGTAVLRVRLLFIAQIAALHVASLAHSIPIAAGPLRASVAFSTLRFLAPGAALGLSFVTATVLMTVAAATRD